MKKYVVELTTKERSQLREIINAKRMAAHKRHHAQMLLKIDQGAKGPGWTDAAVAEAFDCTPRTVERLRIRLTERGFEAALEHVQVGESQLGLDDLTVADRIYGACYVSHVRVFEAPEHMGDGVYLPDVREEQVAQSLAFRGTFHETGDVHELDDRRHARR